MTQNKTLPSPEFAATLLKWYDAHQRILPWRALPGERAEPYHVWLSEIMLQQTTVVTVGPYFASFLKRWPRVEDLAAAELDEVLHAWQGLGYYARARNLHKCAKVVAEELDGKFPEIVEGLLDLPGVGPYTAAAVAAIAFDQPATVVDGNVERVVARAFNLQDPLPGVKIEIYEKATLLTPQRRPGDYAQAMMDLGAGVCTPKGALCSQCPVKGFCKAFDIGTVEQLPRRVEKAKKPTRRGIVFWIENKAGEVLLRRREEKGLLGGLMEVPSSDWQEGPVDESEAFRQSPVAVAEWEKIPGTVRHTFTHFHLHLEVMKGRVQVNESVCPASRWVSPKDFSEHALPTLMKKVVRHAVN